MTPSDGLGFHRSDLDDALRELVDELVAGGQEVDLHVIGGAAIVLAYFGRTYATSDIDAATRQDRKSVVLEAARRVGERHPTWPEGWLNFDADNLIPPGGSHDWKEHLAVGGVRVLVAPEGMLLAMKLRAARPGKDKEDVLKLLPLNGVTSVEEADELFEHWWPGDVMPPRARSWVMQAVGPAT